MSEPVISKELEKKLTQEYGRLSFRDRLMLVYAVSETTQELKAQIEKMKCCENCSHRHYWGNELCCNLDYDKEDECNHNNKKYWEFKEE